jgi:glycosyltransferase involved in cell wall biosynthesis
MTDVDISIVIAARNMERYIEATLASVVQDDYPTREIIVVDDVRSSPGLMIRASRS